ncbi:TerB family tellurite resistance protein [Pedobacter aquatilis]|uniref:TerB family tellurite resistance protein n=1 Tax=Pedobacter aquatilis TaxID=351343 RepID=UPI00293035F7|nr:TerB family tellurite resistance protein [Pedobacter aquatilis]
MSRFRILVLLFFVLVAFRAPAQSAEAQQLLLNVEKLSQLKNILFDMKRGYEVLSKGYNAVRGLAQGNFSLHETFLDGLMMVSPEVRKYHRIAELVSAQVRLVKEYKSAYRGFVSSGSFSASELQYFSRVYASLVSESLDHLEELLRVISSGELRMSDAERLSAIDRLAAQMESKLSFLRDFNAKGWSVKRQRDKEQRSITELRSIYK